MAERRLIDAEKLAQAMYDVVEDTDNECIHIDAVQFTIESADDVDAVEVVHGRWLARPVYKLNSKGKLIHYCDSYHCSECTAKRPIVQPYNYCPSCGAKMDGEEE